MLVELGDVGMCGLQMVFGSLDTLFGEIKMIAKKIDASSVKARSSTDVQGTSYLLLKREFKNADNFALDGDGEDCNK